MHSIVVDNSVFGLVRDWLNKMIVIGQIILAEIEIQFVKNNKQTVCCLGLVRFGITNVLLVEREKKRKVYSVGCAVQAEIFFRFYSLGGGVECLRAHS